MSAEGARRMQRVLKKPEIMVLLAWGITFAVLLLSHWRVGGVWSEPGATYLAGLVVTLAAVATALALGLRNLFLGLLLALPGGLLMWLALALVAFSKFIDGRPIYASMLFFLFCAICGPLLIRSFRDEEIRRKIYVRALLFMVLVAAAGILLVF